MISEVEQRDTILATKYFYIVRRQYTNYYIFINRINELEIDLTTLTYWVS